MAGAKRSVQELAHARAQRLDAFYGAEASPHGASRYSASSKLKAGKAVADSAQQAAIF